MAAAIKDALDADATLEPGSGGVFDVTVNGSRIFSKQQQGRFPEHDEILKSLTEISGVE